MAAHIVLGNLVIDHGRYEVQVGNRRVELTYVEFELLLCLARHAGRVVPRERLLEAVWRDDPPGDHRKLRIHISRLRKKIRDSSPWQIRTVTKRGYALADLTAQPPPVAPRTADPFLSSRTPEQLVTGG